MRTKPVITRLLPAVLVGCSTQLIFAGSSVTASIYENSTIVQTVAIAGSAGATAVAGGVYVEGSVFSGTASSQTVSVDNLLIAEGGGASARLGAIMLKNSVVHGDLRDRTVVADSLIAALKGDSSIGGILAQDARYDGRISSNTAVADRMALSVGGFSLCFFVPAHIGGVRITN